MRANPLFQKVSGFAFIFLLWTWSSIVTVTAAAKEPPPPVFRAPTPPLPAAIPEPPVWTAPAWSPAASKYSVADLERLAGPIALYPDPLIAVILPAAVYPVEIVQAARFVSDTNNLAKLDAQPWDANVKAVARVTPVIEKMNADLAWTTGLGQAFLNQPKELMDSVQTLRFKAQNTGALNTTPQQVVLVTNAVVERTVDQQVVQVTNTVVQIQPANPQVVYVPQYSPSVVYASPVYVDPLVPLITFGVAFGFGLWASSWCDWHYGGVWHGGCGIHYTGGYYHHPYYPAPAGTPPPPYHPPTAQPTTPGTPPGAPPPAGTPPAIARPPVSSPPNASPQTAAALGAVQRPSAVAATTTPATTAPATGQRWQPDPSRLKAPGSAGSLARPSSFATTGTRQASLWDSPTVRSRDPRNTAVPQTSVWGNSAPRSFASRDTAVLPPATGSSSFSRPAPGPTMARPSAAGPAANRWTPSPSRAPAPAGWAGPSMGAPQRVSSAARPSPGAFGGTHSGGGGARGYSPSGLFSPGGSGRVGGGWSGGGWSGARVSGGRR